MCRVYLAVLVVLFSFANLTWAGDDEPDSDYSFALNSAEGTPGSSVTLEMSIDNSEGEELQGWQFGVCHDDAVVSIESEDISTDPQDDIDPPLGFVFQAVVLQGTSGWTVGTTLTLPFPGTLPPGDHVMFEATYTIDAEAEAGTTTDIEFCESLGSPIVTLAVVVAGGDIAAESTNGSIDIIAPTTYVRGDCNDDGTNDIADGIRILSELFQGADAGTCASACDTNGDGQLDQSDAISVFNYQFLEGPPPDAPFPDCGVGDDDDCEAQESCI